jgi:hypothetical protein
MNTAVAAATGAEYATAIQGRINFVISKIFNF